MTPLRAGVLAAPFIALALLFVAGWAGYGPALTRIAETALATVSGATGWLFIWVGLGVLAATVLLAIVTGETRIGGAKTKPGHSAFGAIAIGLAASTSLGLMFWASAEPLYHVHGPAASLDIVPRSQDAQTFALYATMIHWGIIPHLLNALCLVVFGLTTQNVKRRPTLDGVMARGTAPSPVTAGLDGLLVFFATIAVAGAFATCILALSREMTRFGSDAPNAPALFAVALAMIFVVFVAGARPVRRVYGAMARVTLVLMLVLIVAMAVIGPTLPIVFGGFRAFWAMILALPSMLSFTGLADGDLWPRTWTAAHWGNAMLVAPFIGLFLGRVARGFLVSEAILYFSVMPALITILWIASFGGLALSLDEATSGAIHTAMQTGGSDESAFRALWGLPGGDSLIIGFFVLLALAFATFAAMMVHSVMRLCAPGADDDPETGAARVSTATVWCGGVALAGWGLATTGAGAVADTVARLGALPALVIIIGFIIAALRLMLRPAALEPTAKADPVQIDFDLGAVIADEIEESETGPPRARKRRKKT